MLTIKPFWILVGGSFSVQQKREDNVSVKSLLFLSHLLKFKDFFKIGNFSMGN